MKRNLNNHTDGTPVKRTKSSQACTSCRRHKTRCELLDVVPPLGSPLKCHRCKVLSIECSFETSDIIRIVPKSRSPVASTSSSSYTDLSSDAGSNSESASPFQLPMPLASSSSQPLSMTPPVIQRLPRSLHSGFGLPGSEILPRVKVEDLVHSPDSLWGIMNMPTGFDWTATPLLAIQELIKLAPVDAVPPVYVNPNEHLRTILSQDQIASLLEVFHMCYGSWVNVQSHRRCGHTPMLDLVRCAVASRHLDPTTRARVMPRLHKLAEDATLQQVFNPLPSLEYIESLLIFSLWLPIGVGSTQNDTRDPRLLVASAVSMGMNLRLSQASTQVKILRDEGTLGGMSQARLVDCTEKARLWILLSTVESLLCVGTERAPLSRRSEIDYQGIDLASYSTPESARAMRLGLVAKLLDTTEIGYKLHLEDPTGLHDFNEQATQTLMELDCLKRFIAPLPVVVPCDNFHFQILLVQYHTYRLLVLHHFLQEMRRVFDTSGEKPWFRKECKGQDLVIAWTRDALTSAEAVLSHTLSWPEHNLIGTVPDTFFNGIAFAAAWLVMSNFSMYQLHGAQLGGSCDRLLTMIITRLSRAALTPDHAPAKCAHVISALYSAWERLISKPSSSTSASAGNFGSQPRTVPTMMCSNQLAPPSFTSMENYAPSPITAAALNHSWDMGSGSDLFLDNEFWSSFMENLASGQAGSS
ncbi:hypothetical protein BDQ12DRAFT_198358 [Crucibulum laeve]|uniref:Zn(2)-C6 fungal-type domain-containing protein n=1 Tax=Crucibulum laeve TaxID=68775 RepID=A0A5C3MIV9_9AGAR|nr:hypothetical protein BDQ12DRAFT_198358 [Crucibulum laeve]